MPHWKVALLLVLAGRVDAQPDHPFVAPADAQQLLATLRTGSTVMRREAIIQMAKCVQERAVLVPVLVDILDDPDPVVRVAACYSLWRLDRHPRSVTTLVKLCKEPNDQIRLAAVENLREIGAAAPEVLPVLVGILGDRNQAIRLRCVEAIARCVVSVRDESLIEKKVVPSLIEALREDNRQLRFVIAIALGALGSKARPAVEDLEALLDSSTPFLRVAIADALWLIDNHPHSQRTLIELLANEDDMVRRAAVDALGWHGRGARRAVPSIRKLLADPIDRVRSGALLALRCIGEWDESTIRAVARVARQDARWGLRVEALRTLGALGTRAASVKGLVRAAQREDRSVVHLAAAEASWQIEADPEALLAVIEAAGQKDKLLETRWSLSFLDVSDFQIPLGPEALPVLKKLEPRVSAESQIALHKTIIRAGKQDVKMLAGYLNHQLPEVRAEAIQALSNLGPGAKSAVTGIAVRLFDDAEAVRLAAMSTLGQLGPDAAGAVPELCRLLEDSTAGQHVAGVLGRIGPNASEAVPQLHRLLDSRTPMTRYAAAEALALIGGPDVPTLLIPLLDDSNISLCRLATMGLRHSGEAGKPAIARLEAAMKEKDPILRALAAEALWNIARHPESLPTLLSVLKDGTAGRDRIFAVRSLAAIAPTDVLLPALLPVLDDEGPREEALVHLKSLGTRAKAAVPALMRVARRVQRWQADAVFETLLAIDPGNEEIVYLAIEREFDVGLSELARRGPKAEAAVPALQRYIREFYSHGKGFAVADPVLQRIAPQLSEPPTWQEPERAQAEPAHGTERESESDHSLWLVALLGVALGCGLLFRRPRQKGRLHAFSQPS
jgi:HEAT repeat protein